MRLWWGAVQIYAYSQATFVKRCLKIGEEIKNLRFEGNVTTAYFQNKYEWRREITKGGGGHIVVFQSA